MSASSLRLDEADALAAAWVQHLAGDRGIRILLIKGAALSHYGLRERRTSADVDVLVEPARFEEFCAAIADAGWDTRPDIFISRLTTLHSRTYLRDGWPCDLDVHSFFPGFLAEPADVFEALWSRHERLELAHRACNVPSRAGSILILALHSLRGLGTQERHAAELENLVRIELDGDEKAEVARLAHATGCVASLATVLPRMGIEAEPSARELASPVLQDWQERIEGSNSPVYFWLAALRKAPLRDRPTVVWRAFWPTDHDLLVAHPDVPDRFAPKVLARILRWGRGLRSLPRAVSAIWHNRSH